jgi:hypothetical protein
MTLFGELKWKCRACGSRPDRDGVLGGELPGRPETCGLIAGSLVLGTVIARFKYLHFTASKESSDNIRNCLAFVKQRRPLLEKVRYITERLLFQQMRYLGHHRDIDIPKLHQSS